MMCESEQVLIDQKWEARPDGYYINRIMGVFQFTYWVFAPDMRALNDNPLYDEKEAESLIEQDKRKDGEVNDERT